MREEGYSFSCQTFKFYEFFHFKCLLQLFHHLRNFIRHLKKVSSDITAKNPLHFGVWISDETLDTVSLIQLFSVPGSVKPFTPTYSHHI